MAELDPRTALEQSRMMNYYVQSFNGQKWGGIDESPDRKNLAMALDHLMETAAMLGNMAERLAAALCLSPTEGPRMNDKESEMKMRGYSMAYTTPVNQGHGHVTPRPDGVKARCGGPALCAVCQREKAAVRPAQNSPSDEELRDLVIRVRDTFSQSAPMIEFGIAIARAAIAKAIQHPEDLAMMTTKVDFPGRREVETEIRRSANPNGMQLNDGKVNVRLPASTLPLMLRLIDGAKAETEQELAQRLAALGWQSIECDVCGASARAFPPSARFAPEGLPELPEAYDAVWDEEKTSQRLDVYTAEQMREYGKACVAALLKLVDLAEPHPEDIAGNLAAQAFMPITVKVRGTNEELPVVGHYDNTVFVAAPTSQIDEQCCPHHIHFDNACGACVPPRGTK